MELNKTKNGFYILITVSVLMLLLLGSWWLYLVFKLANKLQDLNHPLLEGNLLNMIKWEGTTFFIFLLILTGTLLYIYFQDHKKTKSLQAFFSSLTHELKTPLASIKLQTQVISDLIHDANIEENFKEKISRYTERLVEDSIKLENQLDNHLQLSRVERDGFLNLREISIISFLKKELNRYHDKISYEIVNESGDENPNVLADDFALQTIVRNLTDNTLKHSNVEFPKVKLLIRKDAMVEIHYIDNGEPFEGEASSLGQLFYKYGSPKGSGIGLYLIKNLMRQMKGHIKLIVDPSLNIKLYFQKNKDLK